MLLRCLFTATFILLAGANAHADIGVVLADPTTIGVSEFTHAGHSLVYLSGVCAATPIRARLCAPGEQGAVVTMYPDFYENQRYAWNIVPISLYINGFTNPKDRLLYASAGVKVALQAHARTAFLEPVCGPGHCPEERHAYWRDLVASTVDRDVFIYAVSTSRAQDEAVVAWLNGTPNRNRYNSLTYNCSNFSEDLINAVFPHSVHRDLLNDLLMMSPKSAAHSFTHWAIHAGDVGFYSMHFAQLPGSMPRAGLARSGTEDAIHMKKYLIPAALIGDHEVAGSFFVAYYLTGQFDLYKQYVLNADPAAAAFRAQAKQARKQGNEDEAILLDADAAAARNRVVVTDAAWAEYKKQFHTLCAAPDLRALLPRSGPHPFPAWFAHASISVDAQGNPWLSPSAEAPAGAISRPHDLLAQQALTVGISSEDVLAPGSDPSLAAEMMLARVAYALAAKNHYRESLPVFLRDWALLEQALKRLRAEPAVSIASKNSTPSSAPNTAPAPHISGDAFPARVADLRPGQHR